MKARLNLLLVVIAIMLVVGSTTANAAILNALPSQDTWVGFSGSTDFGNRASDNLLDLQGPNKDNRMQRGLLQYNLAAIPAGSTINSATLRVHNSARFSTGTSHAWEVREIVAGNPWNQNTATWQTYDGVNSWSGGTGGPTGGAFVGTGDALGATPRATTALLAGGNPAPVIDLNLQTLVQDWVNGSIPNLGLAIQSAAYGGTDNENWTVYTAGHANATVNPPELIINYTPIPEPAGLALVAGAALLASRRRTVR